MARSHEMKWDENTPIEIIFPQIGDGQAYATSGNSPYMDAQFLRMAYNLAFQSGNMKEACHDWRRRPSNDQTQKNFVSNCKAAHLDIQHEPTSESAGFQADFSEQAQLTKEFYNVVLANQTHTENLAQSNLSTTEQVTNLLSNITSLQNQVRTLSTCPPCSDRGNSNNCNTGGHGFGRLKCKVNVDLICADDTQTYFWSHGGSIAATHNISNCRYKLPGNNDAATFAKRFGGSTLCCETT